MPFECVYAVEVADCSKVESALHIAFGPSRINPNREFFQIDAEQAVSILKLLGHRDVTPELNRKPNLNFKEMGIADGSELVFKEGSVSVTVNGDKKVILNERVMSLTAATREILNLDYSVMPSPYWTFEGRLQLRVRSQLVDYVRDKFAVSLRMAVQY